ncbi:MAG: nickel/cobalt transporter [Marinobacterium sp.]|nr:nickel/cobalt transporter [Marinobacterium sp.]
MCLSTSLQAAVLSQAASVKHSDSENRAYTVTRQEVSLWNQTVSWVWSQQRQLHRTLTRELRAVRGKDKAGWTLVLTSFLYGIFHAAGPGHGKAVLTTYLLTHRSQLRRGITMGITAAMLQGLTALLLVSGLIGLAGWLPRETDTASLWTTRTSFVLLALAGFYILVRALGALIRNVNALSRNRYNDDHNTLQTGCGCYHLHDHHVHIETAATDSRYAAAGVVLAIGLRPCSGAVLMLILASVIDVMWYGTAAVIAMSVGTAITVVSLAILATKARTWVTTLTQHTSPLWLLAALSAGALGGTLILLLALSLLYTSLKIPPILGV